MTRGVERTQTIVIGGGQAGLSVAYHLTGRGLPCLVLDANPRIGDAWRNRWDSLRLFTPARYDGLDGFPFPAAPHYFPTKDEMADYLEDYAGRFSLPVRSGVRVDRLSRATTGLPGRGGRPAVRGRQRRRRDVELSAAAGPVLGGRARSRDRAGPRGRLPGPVAASRRRGAGGGRGQLGGRHRDGAGGRASRLALGARRRAAALPDRRWLRAALPGAPGAARGVPPGADGSDADGPEAAAEGALPGRAPDPGQVARPGGRGGAPGAQDGRGARRPARARGRGGARRAERRLVHRVRAGLRAGSSFRSSAITSPSTKAAWCRVRPGSTSSGSTSWTR